MEPKDDIKQFYEHLKDDLNLSATQKLEDAVGEERKEEPSQLVFDPAEFNTSLN